MAYSTDVSKRKFHRLLESISDNLRPTTSSAAASAGKPSSTNGASVRNGRGVSHAGHLARKPPPGDSLSSSDRLTTSDSSDSSLFARGASSLPYEPPSKRLKRLRDSSQRSSAFLRSISPQIRAAMDTRRILSQTASTIVVRNVSGESPRPGSSLINDGAAAADELQLDSQYRPWDRAQFLRRLKTFSGRLDLWRPKPDIVHEVHWAKRGWSRIAPETVVCNWCLKRILVDLQPDRAAVVGADDLTELELDDELEKVRMALAARYATLIRTGHHEGCFWRDRGCDVGIQRLPLAHPETALLSLNDRYRSLLKIHFALPQNLEIPDDLDLEMAFEHFMVWQTNRPRGQAGSPIAAAFAPNNVTNRMSNPTPAASSRTSIPPSSAPARPVMTSKLSATAAPSQPEPSSPISPTASLSDQHRAFALALFGWHGDPASSGPSHEVAACSACFRRCGLWIWAPPVNPVSNEPLDDPAPRMSVVWNHIWHCPWTNAESQNAGTPTADTADAKPGWEMQLDAIYIAASWITPTAPTSPVSATGPKTSEQTLYEQPEDSRASLSSIDGMTDSLTVDPHKAVKPRNKHLSILGLSKSGITTSSPNRHAATHSPAPKSAVPSHKTIDTILTTNTGDSVFTAQGLSTGSLESPLTPTTPEQADQARWARLKTLRRAFTVKKLWRPPAPTSAPDNGHSDVQISASAREAA